ncbi:hypothetical protein RFI_28949 [Reticulomyxa filosa]|uniref:Uncharacterized protein n=1 Tax=Reticulomyxa filosa TaxID=46433 RepID=X6M3D9_RETFI|nr:hypothetical protein RFI_28949 [Reticulomyxa filosa]|eukprot:ETO08439.1 hypothetical protein RFI_28949 [Reticulomyxa filosa]
MSVFFVEQYEVKGKKERGLGMRTTSDSKSENNPRKGYLEVEQNHLLHEDDDDNDDSESEINPFVKQGNKPKAWNEDIPQYLCIYTVLILGGCILFAVVVGVLLGFLLGMSFVNKNKTRKNKKF